MLLIVLHPRGDEIYLFAGPAESPARVQAAMPPVRLTAS
jgi:hypothetical protein